MHVPLSLDYTCLKTRVYKMSVPYILQWFKLSLAMFLEINATYISDTVPTNTVASHETMSLTD